MMLFVCGTGRCGHTIMAKEIIGRHPDVASVPFETRFIIDPDGIIDFYASSTATWSYYLPDRRLKRLERFLDDISRKPSWGHRLLSNLIRRCDPDGRFLSPKAYCQWELDKHFPNFRQHSEELIRSLTAFSYLACWFGMESYKFRPHIRHMAPMSKEALAPILGDFLRKVIHEIQYAQGKAHYVDGNVFTIQLCREILELLPEARILHVYRDPRDVVASFVHQRWCPKSIPQAALIYKYMMEYWFDVVRPVLPTGSYMEVSFEHFITHPRKTLEEICRFAGLTYDAYMLDEDRTQHNRQRWCDEFSTYDRNVVQEILGDIMERLGYR